MRLYLLILFSCSIRDVICLDIPSNLTDIIDLVTQLSKDTIDFNLLCDLNLTEIGVDKKCVEQMTQICKNRTVGLTMLDATSKFPYTGMMKASRFDFGNYDECVDIEYRYDSDSVVLGKFCLAGLVIPDPKNVTSFNLFYKLSTCIPDKCSAKDMNAIAGTFVKDFPPLFRDEVCTTKETNKDISPTALFVIGLLILWTALMVFSTIYDLYLYYNEKKAGSPILIAFSVFTNGRKLFATSAASKQQIEVLNGMRVISIMWVIAGHAVLLWAPATERVPLSMFPVTDAPYIDAYHSSRISFYQDGGHMAVDTFFLMSGFLLSYLYLKEKRTFYDQIRTIPMLYLHRIIRLMPSVAMLYLVARWVIPLTGSGPVWNAGCQATMEPCVKYWWSYFLFVQNYVNYDDLCLIHTWYLSADMQMYLLSPLLLIPLSLILEKRKGFLFAAITMAMLCLIFVVAPIAVQLNFPEYDNAFDTHSRLIDYLLGISLGLFFREKMHEPFLYFIKRKYHRNFSLLVWTVVLVGMFTAMFFYQDAEVYQGPTSRAYYYVLARTAWCVGLCWIIYACQLGHGGFVSWILNRSIYQALSRLTYSMYLTHLLVLAWYGFQNRIVRYPSHYEQFYLWCGHYTVTTVFSVLWTLAFESPIIAIEKVLFRRRPEPKKNMITSQGRSEP